MIGSLLAKKEKKKNKKKPCIPLPLCKQWTGNQVYIGIIEKNKTNKKTGIFEFLLEEFTLRLYIYLLALTKHRRA